MRIFGVLYFLQLAVLQEEWKSRSLASQLTTGAELAESSTTDGFQHPRIRFGKLAAGFWVTAGMTSYQSSFHLTTSVMRTFLILQPTLLK